MSARVTSDWIGPAQAARILGVPGVRTVKRLERLGVLPARKLPGVRGIYRLDDVERLARESLPPETAAQAG